MSQAVAALFLPVVGQIGDRIPWIQPFFRAVRGRFGWPLSWFVVHSATLTNVTGKSCRGNLGG